MNYVVTYCLRILHKCAILYTVPYSALIKSLFLQCVFIHKQDVVGIFITVHSPAHKGFPLQSITIPSERNVLFASIYLGVIVDRFPRGLNFQTVTLESFAFSHNYCTLFVINPSPFRNTLII